MTEEHIALARLYKGWDVYQQLLTKAIAPLSPEQLALRAAPELRSIGMIAAHIIGARARWFHRLMGEGSADIHLLGNWDRSGAPARSAAELVDGNHLNGHDAPSIHTFDSISGDLFRISSKR